MPPVRRLFTFASVMSLLICLAALLFYRLRDSGGAYYFEFGLGGNSIWYVDFSGGDFAIRQSNPYQLYTRVEAAVRLWLIAGIALLLPMSRLALWFVRRERSHLRKRAGRCICCSYDLTGNVSGVCPECGTKISN